MSATTPASRSAAPSQSPSKPQPGATNSGSVQAIFEAHNATSTARGCIERGHLVAARRQLARALAAINQAIGQGGAV